MEKPRTISALIDALGGNAKYGRIIGKGASTAGEQKRTGSIPVEYWPAIVRAAAALKIPGINFETLALMNLGTRPRLARSRADDRSRASA
jgi:hypothetical protein